jgi:hypothetical protein
MNQSESLRRLRILGYLVMATMTLVQIIDVVIRAMPFRIQSPAWRLGVVGLAANAVGTPMLAFLVILAIAVWAGDRGVVYLMAVLSALAAVLCLLATGTFALDALQMKSQVQAGFARQYDIASFWLAARVVVAAGVFLVFGVSAFRMAKTVRRELPKPAVRGSGSLVVGMNSPASTQRGIGAERR